MSSTKKNINLNDKKIKRKILEKVCASSVSKIFYSKESEINLLTQDKNKVEYIANNKKNYIVYSRYFGTRSILVITKIDNVYYVVNFPKHKLNLQYDKLSQLTLIPIEESTFHDKLYDDTIAVGTYSDYLSKSVNDNEEVRKRIFVIEDVYCIAGKNLSSINNRAERLSDMKQILDNYKNVKQSDKFKISVVDYYFFDLSIVNIYKNLTNDSIDQNIEKIVIAPIKMEQTLKRTDKNMENMFFYYVIKESDRADNHLLLGNTIESGKVNYEKFYMTKDKKTGVFFLINYKSNKKEKNPANTKGTLRSKYESWFGKEKKILVYCKKELDNDWTPMEKLSYNKENDSD